MKNDEMYGAGSTHRRNGNANKVLEGKSEEKRSLGIPGCRCENNV
jgi:hypothetical protein